jgi:Ca2+-binding RTX toxin-like protein
MSQHTSARPPLVALVMLMALLAALLVPARPAYAAFTGTLTGSVATLNGDAEGDIVLIDVTNGLLNHNAINGPNFADNFDFNTTVAGSQHLAAAAGAKLTINAGGGNDTIFVGDLALVAGITIVINGGDGDDKVGLSAPFRGLALVGFDGGLGNDSLTYDERNDPNMPNIFITASQVAMTNGVFAGYSEIESLTVSASQNDDTIAVRGSAAATPIEINNLSGAGIDRVNIGQAGSTQQVLGDILVTNQTGATELTVDDSAATAGRAITIADGTIDGIAPATIAYAPMIHNTPVIIKSGNGADTFSIASAASVPPKWLMSGGGDDRFVFADGATLSSLGKIDGGDGIDTLDYSAYTSSVSVFAGSATGTQSPGGIANIEGAIGGSADDELFGRNGVNAFLKGNGGADWLQGGSGDDTLDGDSGVDTLKGGDGDDVLIWNDGDQIDTLLEGGLGANDRLDVGGGPAADTFSIGSNSGRLVVTYSAPVSQTLSARTIERVSVGGRGGPDTLTAVDLPPGPATVAFYGEDGNDTLIGSAGADILDGGPGNDTIDGNAGDDSINGRVGDDTVNGGAGNDTIHGDSGDDLIAGGAGNDTIEGGTDIDALNGDAGDDTLRGGAGADTLGGGTGDDMLAWDAGDGSDVLEGGAGNDTLRAGGSITLNDRFSITPAAGRFHLSHALSSVDTLDVGTTEAAALASGGGDDIFDIIALGATVIALDGGPHSAGDTLNFNPQGLKVTHTPGRISVPGRQPVTYMRIEKVNTEGSGGGPERKIFIPLIRK